MYLSSLLIGETININVIVSGFMSRQGIDPMINHTRGEYSNHYVPMLFTITITRRDDKYILTRNQDNVSEWRDISIIGLLFQ
jgi:hypothetical protein